MNEYVLGKHHPEMNGTVFICGNHPRMPGFHPDVEYATKFTSVEEALAFRHHMNHQLGGKEKYRVHQVLPGGRVIDVEG